MRRQQVVKFLIMYVPSFFTRYSIQLMIVALPWILQLKNAEILSVSATFAAFFTGSLFSGVFAGRIIGHFESSRMMFVLIFALSLLTFFALYLSQIEVLTLVRFFQGAILGILRPLSKIWFIEWESAELDSVELARRSAWSEIVVAAGMTAGAWAGGQVEFFWAMPNAGLFFATAASFLPLVAFIFGFWYLRKSGDLHYRVPVQSIAHQKSIFHGLRTGICFFLNDPKHLSVLLLYILSLAIFKIWIVGLPFYWREVLGDGSIREISKHLVLILSIHPIAFLVGNWFVVAGKRTLSRLRTTSLIAVATLTILSGCLTWAAAFCNSWWIACALVGVGGGLLSSMIYPFCMLVVGEKLKKSDSFTLRQVMLVFSLAADLGQIIGVVLLSYPIWKKLPLSGMAPALVLTVMALAISYLYGKRTV